MVRRWCSCTVWAATSNCFQPLLPSSHGFRCIRPDFPGAGRSPRPYVPVTVDSLAETALDVVKIIAGGPAHIVGHSMGTLVAQHLGGDCAGMGPEPHPVRPDRRAGGGCARTSPRTRRRRAPDGDDRRRGRGRRSRPFVFDKGRQSCRRGLRAREPPAPGRGRFRRVVRSAGRGEGGGPSLSSLPDDPRDRRRRSDRAARRRARACGQNQGR